MPFQKGHLINKGRKNEKIRDSRLGKHWSKEIKEKISLSKKGQHYKPRTEEHSKKIREALNKSYILHPEWGERFGKRMKGRKVSIETRKKISIAKKGEKHTIEHTRKVLARRPMSSLEVKVQKVIDKYNLRLVDYGFLYHRDSYFPRDDSTWFLLEKC